MSQQIASIKSDVAFAIEALAGVQKSASTVIATTQCEIPFLEPDAARTMSAVSVKMIRHQLHLAGVMESMIEILAGLNKQSVEQQDQKN